MFFFLSSFATGPSPDIHHGRTRRRNPAPVHWDGQVFQCIHYYRQEERKLSSIQFIMRSVFHNKQQLSCWNDCLILYSALSSAFWPHMQACWAFSFSTNWSPRNRRLSHKSKHVGAPPFPHCALPIGLRLLAVTWHTLSLSLCRSPFWPSFLNQLGLDVLVIKWLFGFPVLTINMYAQNVKKKAIVLFTALGLFFF